MEAEKSHLCQAYWTALQYKISYIYAHFMFKVMHAKEIFGIQRQTLLSLTFTHEDFHFLKTRKFGLGFHGNK